MDATRLAWSVTNQKGRTMRGRWLPSVGLCAGLALLPAWSGIDRGAHGQALDQSASATLHLIPASAEAVIQVKGLDGFRDRLHQFIRETIPAAAEDIRRTLDEQVRAFLEQRDRKHLDGQRPIFFVLQKWQNVQAQPPAIVIGIPVRDGKAFLQGFLSPEEQRLLKPHATGCQSTRIAGQEVFIHIHGAYVLLTPRVELAELLVALTKPNQPGRRQLLHFQLRPEDLQQWSEADVAVYFKVQPLLEWVGGQVGELRKKLQTASPKQPYGHSLRAIYDMALDLWESGREIEYCVVTGHLGKEGLRLQATARVQQGSRLSQSLAQVGSHNVSVLDRLPEGMLLYGSWQTGAFVELALQRYAQAVRQAKDRPVPASALERLLVDTAEPLSRSGIRRLQWGLDATLRGLLVIEAEKPKPVRDSLTSLFENLATLVPKDCCRINVQREGGQLFGMPASRVDLQFDWVRCVPAHRTDSRTEARLLANIFGERWTLWLVNNNRQIFIASTRDFKEAQRWIQRYCSSTEIPLRQLRNHRAALGDELTGISMLQFPGWWRHMLEGIEKLLAAEGLGNLIPKDSYPGNTPAFFAVGCKITHDAIILELWAPKETVSELNRLWTFALQGLF